MVERQIRKKGTGPWEAHPPPMTASQFENTPEFRKLKTGMKELLKVSKIELDRMISAAKGSSLRAENPTAPGRRKQDRSQG